MGKKNVNIYTLKNGYKEILDSIDSGHIYLGENQEVIIIIKRIGGNSNYKGIAYSLLTYNIASFKVNKNELRQMHRDLLSKIIDEQYEFEDEQEKLEDNMGTALIELRKMRKNHKVR